MVDWNSVLAYETYKVVRIRDWRLGALNYAFMLAVIIYVIVYSVWIKMNYLLTEAPVGSLRLSLMPGSHIPELDDMKYCKTPQHPSYNGFPNAECLFADGNIAVYPQSEATAIMATTYLTIDQQSLSCPLTQRNCSFESYETDTYYIADIEHYTLMIDHTMIAPSLNIQANAKSLPGELVDLNDNVVTFPDNDVNVVGRSDRMDILELGVLLKAAGRTSLDDGSGYNATQSFRRKGLVMIVSIEYSNTWSHNTNAIKYTYKPRLVDNSEFKNYETFLTNNTARTLYTRHGLRIIFIQSGLIGRFSPSNLLLAFVGGLGLVAVSTVIVDIIATKIVRQKHFYEKHKYQDAERPTRPLSAVNTDNASEYEPITA